MHLKAGFATEVHPSGVKDTWPKMQISRLEPMQNKTKQEFPGVAAASSSHLSNTPSHSKYTHFLRTPEGSALTFNANRFMLQLSQPQKTKWVHLFYVSLLSLIKV